MKIMLVIGSLRGGGAERVMHWLAENLAAQGHDVTLVTQQPKEEDVYLCSYRVSHKSMGGMCRVAKSSVISFLVNSLRWRRFLLNTADETRPDVVLSFLDKINVSVLLAFLFRREPVVVCERIDPAAGPNISWRRYVRPWLYRNRATEVVFQTAGVQERFSKKWKLRCTNRVPNAVTKSFFDAEVKPGGQLVIAVGRLHPQKGHDLLIDAWAKLGDRRGSWQLRIIGEGPLRQEYETMVSRLGVVSSVEIVGFRPDVISELQQASIAVLASRWEGFPNALVEMMALGRAVIASDLPEGCTELVASGQNGLLFDGTSSEALAKALGKLIEDRDLRRILGENALNIRTRYSEDICMKLWTECIERARHCD